MDGLSSDELSLARAAALDDAGGREVIARRLAPGMLRLLRTFARNAEDAEDLAGAAPVRVLVAIGRYDGRAPLRAWAFAIAVNEGHPEPGDRFARADDAALLSAAMARLPLAQREAFALVAVEGFESAEAALALGVPEGTVKSRVHHARRHLRLFLAPAFPERLTPLETDHVPDPS